MTLTQTFIDVMDTANDLGPATTNILTNELRDVRKPSLVRVLMLLS
jgi:hypothetical protein